MKRRHSAVSRPMANINVTSLLDITFVLLIAFMVIAPALNHGVELELPKVRKAPVTKKADPVSVAVKPGADGDAEIYVNGQAVQLDLLVDKVRELRGGSTDRAVTLDGDRRVEWEAVAQVITELRQGGIENIGIMTNVPSTGSR
ncbi:biopolymer transporter ExbD [Candidatus Poribacteria bacterium]|nr:biopolymer transporter ExbD [Candidatus Poribacteria bacterium]